MPAKRRATRGLAPLPPRASRALPRVGLVFFFRVFGGVRLGFLSCSAVWFGSLGPGFFGAWVCRVLGLCFAASGFLGVVAFSCCSAFCGLGSALGFFGFLGWSLRPRWFLALAGFAALCRLRCFRGFCPRALLRWPSSSCSCAASVVVGSLGGRVWLLIVAGRLAAPFFLC